MIWWNALTISLINKISISIKLGCNVGVRSSRENEVYLTSQKCIKYNV